MKLSRINLFIGTATIALIIVLIIQVQWIIQSAKIKEEIFNEKANMVLSKTAEVLSTDEQACRNIENNVGDKGIQKTDSLFTNYMKFYDFNTYYSFKVSKPGSSENIAGDNGKNNVYKKRLEEEATKNGLELNLFLPGKKQFIVQEMGPLFITSVILIIVVLILFWKTIRSLIRQRQISEYTTDFLNNMTHEFKTPLTNIALAGRMIIKDSSVQQEEKIRHYSGIILEENEKLRMQVEQVLSMTALERGEIPLHKTICDFHKIIDDSLKHLNIQIENRHGKVYKNLDAVNHKVSGVPVHLTNAMCNLIDNAIKYSTDSPELTIKTFNENDNLIICISDQGIGIDKEFHKKVFEKFFRVPTGDVHDVKGFGLGLSYIKKIIEMHQGSIDLQSEKRSGAAFIISLPYA
jgi:two-component system phosphate regulon sensor histidine kinase PhoR